MTFKNCVHCEMITLIILHIYLTCKMVKKHWGQKILKSFTQDMNIIKSLTQDMNIINQVDQADMQTISRNNCRKYILYRYTWTISRVNHYKATEEITID